MKEGFPFLKDFFTAVKQLVTLPLPVEASSSLKQALNWFPVAGLVIGTLAVMVITIVGWILPDAVTAVAGAIAFTYFLYYINQRRNINSLLKVSKQLGNDMQSVAHDELGNQVGAHLNLIVIIFVFFCKVVVAGTLIYFGNALWLALVPLFSASCLALFFINARQEDLRLDKNQRMMPWFIALALAIVVAGIKGFAMGVIVWFICQQAYDVIKKHSPQRAQNMVFASCELLECLTLFGGLLLGNL